MEFWLEIYFHSFSCLRLLGETHYTGKMHRQGTPPFCKGFQCTAQVGTESQAVARHQDKLTKPPQEMDFFEVVNKFKDSVSRSEEKLWRSMKYSFSTIVDDLPGKVARFAEFLSKLILS